MNNKTIYTILFILSAITAGSIAINILQVRSTLDPVLEQDRGTLAFSLQLIRRSGVIASSTPSTGLVEIEYHGTGGTPADMQVWVTSGTLIQRTHMGTSTDGIVRSMSVEPITQADLQVGEPVYMGIVNSVANNRFEASLITVGDVLPEVQGF